MVLPIEEEHQLTKETLKISELKGVNDAESPFVALKALAELPVAKAVAILDLMYPNPAAVLVGWMRGRIEDGDITFDAKQLNVPEQKAREIRGAWGEIINRISQLGLTHLLPH